MSIEKTDVVDLIGVDRSTGDVVLTITDHLEWGVSDNEHLYLLQEKINTYLAFVEGGEIFSTYPDAKNRQILIDVVSKYPCNEEAIEFYKRVTSIIQGAGFHFRYRVVV